MIRLAAALALLALAPTRAAAQAPAKPDAGAAKPTDAPAASPAPAQAKPGGEAASAPQGREAGAKPSKVALDLARALTPRDTWDGILDAYATSLTGQISAALGASGKEPAPDLRRKIRSDLDETVRYDAAIEMQGRALAFRFSPEELATLERFYRSGPGRKLLDVLPEVSREVNDDLRARLSARVPELVKKHAPSLAEGAAGGARESGTASGAGAGGPGEASGGAAAKPEGKAEGEKPRR